MKNIKIDELKFYENNPRHINEKAITALMNSIREFGFRAPVIVDVDNVIIAGHTRVLAAKKVGLLEVPCVIADDLTPEQVKAYRLVDNKIAELTTWDFEKLDIEIGDINFDMSDFGFKIEIPEEKTIKNEEIDIDDFSEDKFKHECPRCGFKF